MNLDAEWPTLACNLDGLVWVLISSRFLRIGELSTIVRRMVFRSGDCLGRFVGDIGLIADAGLGQQCGW
jgi:hypothetical protein